MYYLIHTYRTSCKTVEQPPGFGDFLRGSAALYQLSKKYGFNLKIDFSCHPLSQYLEQTDSVAYDDNAEVHEFFNQNNAALEPFISTLPENSQSLVTTHCVPVSGIDEGCRRFLKKRLSPTRQLQTTLKDVMNQLGRDYCVVHLRMGDHSIGGGCSAVPAVDTWFRDIIVPEWGDRILVLSDNSWIKEHLSERFGSMFILNTPVHLGQCGTLEFPRTGVRDSMVDFFTMSKAQKIYQYSVYPWGSGFSDMCTQIYRIPLIKIIPMV
ncbi:MAG: hypothetical protein A2X83_13050 [Desulfuromonadales bacterium GWD2_54_10]|nr:MAG: hypothetical protein A2X83_13050 [Desulfuromonadales bacterium GWD2_54_10]